MRKEANGIELVRVEYRAGRYNGCNIFNKGTHPKIGQKGRKNIRKRLKAIIFLIFFFENDFFPFIFWFGFPPRSRFVFLCAACCCLHVGLLCTFSIGAKYDEVFHTCIRRSRNTCTCIHPPKNNTIIWEGGEGADKQERGR